MHAERDFHVHCHKQILQEYFGEGIHTGNLSSNTVSNLMSNLQTFSESL